MLDERVDHVRKAGGPVTESYLRLGAAAKEIVELAEELEVGLMVLRSRALGGIRRALMGSVSTSVLRHAHCSVLIVRGYGPEQEARTREALIEAMGIALPAVRARNARGFFGHYGYGSVGQPL